MNEWYVPITILPGICLLILSTTNIVLDLSKEINQLIKEADDRLLIERKLKQLKLLNRSMVFLYVASASFVISGLLAGFFESEVESIFPSKYLVFLGISAALWALSNLIVYSSRAVRIRQDQHKQRFNQEQH